MQVIQQAAEVKSRIVASAQREFGRKGYAGASLREIAERAGTTKPMIYYYFGNKEGLYASIVQEQMQSLTRRLSDAVAGANGVEDKIRCLVAAYLDHHARNRQNVAVFFKEVTGSGEAMVRLAAESYEETVVGALSQIVREGVEAGLFKPVDPLTCAISILGIANGFVLRQLTRRAAFDCEVVLSQVMDYFVAGLRAPESPAAQKSAP
ncbi:MAG: TetR/AcrR family transcriptional regulator [Chloroflexota bacterium]